MQKKKELSLTKKSLPKSGKGKRLEGCVYDELHMRKQCLCFKGSVKSPDFRDKK